MIVNYLCTIELFQILNWNFSKGERRYSEWNTWMFSNYEINNSKSDLSPIPIYSRNEKNSMEINSLAQNYTEYILIN